MTTYRIKKILTLMPFVVLISVSLFLLIYSLSVTHAKEAILGSILCFIISMVFVFLSLIRLDTTKEYIATSYIKNFKKIKWGDVFEIKIVKSSTSGYSVATISYYNDRKQKGYFIVGSWFGNSEKLFSELMEKAVNAKIY